MIPAFVINLPQDVDRHALIQTQLDNMPEFRYAFVEGVVGSTLPNIVCATLSTKYWASSKGSIGCFLSHVRVWELVSQEATAPFSIVLEDDTDLSQLYKVSLLECPADFDIIFINDRMSAGLPIVEGDFVDMATALKNMDISNGLGADGYLLTPSAARKLLSALEQDLYTGHVDGRLLRYSSTEADVDTLEPDSFKKQVLQFHHDLNRLPQLGLLKGYVSTLPYVRHMGLISSRAKADAFGI